MKSKIPSTKNGKTNPEYSHEWYEKNKIRHQKLVRKWRRNNPEKTKAIKLKYEQNHPDRVKNGYLKRKYGISLKDHQNLVEKQDNKCAICSREFKRIPYVDHNHTTNKVRGLLCNRCNVFLGWYEKYKTIIENYLLGNNDT